MGHHHSHHHNTTHNIKRAFFLNLSFTIVELIGGVLTNSLAIMSDALHDLGDSLTLGLSWYFQKLSNKKADATYSYGYRRFSVLGAFINSVILVVGSVFIISEAIPRIIHPEQSDAKGMMWLAVLGIIVNGMAVLNLKKGKSLNERVIMLHLLEDVLGWVAVLIGSIVMQFWDVPILDAVLSVAIAVFILFNTYKGLKDSLRILLQATPKNVQIIAIQTRLQQFDEIRSVHNARLWTLDGSYHVLTIHLVLKEDTILSHNLNELKTKIRTVLHDEFHLEDVTLEFELKGKNRNHLPS